MTNIPTSAYEQNVKQEHSVNSKYLPLKSGITAFVLTFLCLLLLLASQFIYKYREDFFHKNLEISALVKITVLTMISLAPVVLPICFLVFGLAYYRRVFLIREANVNHEIRKTILPLMLCSLAGFTLNSFVVPPFAFKQMGLLYDIRMKPVEQPLERTDLNVFRGQRYGSTLSELRHLSDSINDRLQTIKTEFSQGNQTSQDSAGMKFLTDLEEKKRMKTQFEEWKMTAFPFFLALSFFIGMFIGIINRDVRNPFFLALALFATIFPVMYFVLFFLEGLAKNQTLSPFLAEIIFLSLLSLTAFFLYRYATSPKRRWRIAS